MNKPVFNPYLPSWEYIPDGEPHVYDGRVYVYGSHDHFDGFVFCPGDYTVWSAPADDLSAWRCEGVTYERTADPINKDGRMCLYAPDVTKGPDGRYYLYYVYDKVNYVSVAVCDTPAGRFHFLGYVRHKNGALYGTEPGDEPQFDPAVITEGEKTYLYTGFCGRGDKSRHGAMCVTLSSDMLTIEEEVVFVAPGCEYASGTGFEGHAFFEGPSIRKRGGLYYFIYSSQWMHELCYAISKDPRGPFTYGGVIVSNNDIGIGTYKKPEQAVAYGGNNHGSICEIGEKWYIFYHRHTNGCWYSRQGCAEEIFFDDNGAIAQVEITSCGLNGGPLPGKGTYPAYIACHLYTRERVPFAGDPRAPHVRQDGRDGDPVDGYICSIQDDARIGFKCFDLTDTRSVGITFRCYCDGYFDVTCDENETVLCSLPVHNSNVWESVRASCHFPAGVHTLYFTYRGTGSPSLGSVTLE